MDERLSISMNFYSTMATAAHFGKPEMLPFVACRMVQYTMEKGLCKFSIMGFVQFAGVLCTTSKIAKERIEGASQIAKAAMSCSKTRYDTTEQLPFLYCAYYGFVAFHTEPLQLCAAMLRQGFDAGMSLGDTGNAFFNSVQHIKTALVAGDRLPTLLQEVDYYLKLATTYQNESAKMFLSVNRGTISLLLGGEPSLTPHAIDVPNNTANADVLVPIYYHRAIQAYWQGHNERCEHYIGKWLKISSTMGMIKFITFLQGMNSFQLLKRTSNGRLRSLPRNAILVLKAAASLSDCNFSNKVRCNRSLFDAVVFLFTLLTREISKFFSRSGAILISGPSVRSGTVFPPIQKQRSPSILCRCHQLRSIVWLHPRARTRM